MNLYEIEDAYRNGLTLGEIRNLYIPIIENIKEEKKIEIWEQVCGYANEDMIAYLLSIGWRAAGVVDNRDNTLLHLLANPLRSLTEYFVNDGKVYTCTNLLLEAKVSSLRKNKDEKTALILSAQFGYPEMLLAYHEKKLKIDFTDRNGNTVLHLIALYYKDTFNEYNHISEQLDRHLQRISDFPINEQKFELEKSRMERRQNICRIKTERFITYATMALEFGLDPYQKNNEKDTAIDIAVKYNSKAIGAILIGSDFSNPAMASLYMEAGGMDIYQACEKGDLDALNALIQLEAPLNEICDKEDSSLNGLLPLAIAMIKHNSEVISILLQKGANPNYTDSKSWHPFRYLFTPESNGNTNSEQFKNKVFTKILKSFLDSGFDINSPIDDEGNTLLLTAARFLNGQTLYNSNSVSKDLIEELIYLDADVNATNQDGVSTLMYLCLTGSERAENNIITILEQGASTELKDKNGKTALIYAAQNSNTSTAKTYCELLSEFGNLLIDAKDNSEKSALDYAVEKNNEALVSWLISKM